MHYNSISQTIRLQEVIVYRRQKASTCYLGVSQMLAYHDVTFCHIYLVTMLQHPQSRIKDHEIMVITGVHTHCHRME